MEFLKRLFGRKDRTYADSQRQTEQKGKRNVQADGVQVDAAALVCDAWIMFDGGVLGEWVGKVLRAQWPSAELPPMERVHMTAGFKGNEEEARAKSQELLQETMAEANLKRDSYDLEFFSVQSEAPPMRVWCMAAVRHSEEQDGPDEMAAFVETLQHHLERVRKTSPQLSSFLDQYFDDSSIAAIAPAVVEKMRLTQSDGKQHSTVLGQGAVVYHISTLPVGMNQAKDWFVRNKGGYTQLLEHVQSSVLAQQTNCSVWCHIIHGWSKWRPWVQMAIVPVREPAPISVAIMPIEFLTPKERRDLGL